MTVLDRPTDTSVSADAFDDLRAVERRALWLFTAVVEHALAFLAGVHGLLATHVGVNWFGQSGDLESVYRYDGIDPDSIMRAFFAHVG